MRKILIIVFSLIAFFDTKAQKIVTTQEIFSVTGKPDSTFQEVNALIFMPPAYKKVIPQENYVQNNGQRNNQFDIEHWSIYYKNDIYISVHYRFVTLSSFYEDWNEKSSPEDALKRHNSNLINAPEEFGLGNSYTLLEDVSKDCLKLINADSVFIYNSNKKFKVNSETDNYGSIVVNLIKFDLGRARLVYYYPLEKYKKVLQEINNTWGVVRFKPDIEFNPVDNSGSFPKRRYPYDLYFGKFSHLNDPVQVKEEEEAYHKRLAQITFSRRIAEANNLAMKGDLNGAKSSYALLLKEDPKNAIIYNQLALIAMNENKKDSTWHYWNKLHEVSPHAIQTWFLKGGIEKRFNDLDSAKNTFEKLLLTSDTINPFLHMELANVYSRLGLKDKASKAYERLLNIFSVEREKGLKGESHRMLSFQQLKQARFDYAVLLNSIQELDKSIKLMETTLDDQKMLFKAQENREKTGIYGFLDDRHLADVYFLLGVTYGMSKMEVNARVNLEEAKRLGKVIPIELEDFMNSKDN